MTNTIKASFRLNDTDAALLYFERHPSNEGGFSDAIKLAFTVVYEKLMNGDTFDWISVKDYNVDSNKYPFDPKFSAKTFSFYIEGEIFNVVTRSIKQSLSLKQPRVTFLVRLVAKAALIIMEDIDLSTIVAQAETQTSNIDEYLFLKEIVDLLESASKGQSKAKEKISAINKIIRKEINS